MNTNMVLDGTPFYVAVKDGYRVLCQVCNPGTKTHGAYVICVPGVIEGARPIMSDEKNALRKINELKKELGDWPFECRRTLEPTKN